MKGRRAENSYILHKVQFHNGSTNYNCATCAEFEDLLTPGKLRRDSE